MNGLDIARALILAGVPVFRAMPARTPEGDWDPTGGHHKTGYWLPGGWQETVPDERVVDYWREGDALALVCGHGLDLVDIDPRNGGSLDALMEAVPDIDPLGVASSPSDGTHLFIPSLGVRSRDGALPGIDVKAGADGVGRGFAFIAPTVRLSKVTGEAGTYHWTTAPDLSRLGTAPPQRLLDLVNEARAQRPQSTLHTTWEAVEEGERRRLQTYLDAAVAGIRSELLGASLWPEGVTDERGRGWQKVTADAAMRLGSLALASWSPWTMEDAYALFVEAMPPTMAHGGVDVDREWLAQSLRGGPAAYPVARTVEGLLDPTIPVAGDTQNEGLALYSDNLHSGGGFILDVPDGVPAVWGEKEKVLWAEGESMMLTGQPGTGKTTVVGQVVRALIVGGVVLGLPVTPRRRTLYLAMDRPQQIRRALRRTLRNLPREVLDAGLVVWQGPPPQDVAARPHILRALAEAAGADTVIIDSVKDAAVGLTNDEVGASYNRARQLLLAGGIQVAELHHTVKRDANGNNPDDLAGVYGSMHLTSGAGSVILLKGVAGDPVVKLKHLKTPAAEVGPFDVVHDHDAGLSHVVDGTDLLGLLHAHGDSGITARVAAAKTLSKINPAASEVEKARRALDRLVKQGVAVKVTNLGGADVWKASLTTVRAPVRGHGFTDPSREEAFPQVNGGHAPLTPLTKTGPHVFPPLLKGENVTPPESGHPHDSGEPSTVERVVAGERTVVDLDTGAVTPLPGEPRLLDKLRLKATTVPEEDPSSTPSGKQCDLCGGDLSELRSWAGLTSCAPCEQGES